MTATDEHAYEINCATTTPHGPHQYLRLLNPPEERMQAQRYCHGINDTTPELLALDTVIELLTRERERLSKEKA